MTQVRTVLLAGGIAMAVIGAAPASAAVLQTSVLWADTSAGAYHQCNVTNTGTKALASGSKVEIVFADGTVEVSSDVSGLPPGVNAGSVDYSTSGFEYCRFTGTKNVRANLIVFFYDGTKYLSLATDDAR
jgi:hypothetical protein